MRTRSWMLASLTLVASCSAPGTSPDVPTGDGGVDAPTAPIDAGPDPAGCRDDGACDDGVFCNGSERCAPGVAGADDRGCAPALEPASCGPDETCDATEDRCVGPCTSAPDEDGDGDARIACGGTDCDDADPTVNGSAMEACDGVDDDCDGTIDDGVTSRFFADMDGDGYGDPSAPVDACAPSMGLVTDAGDCDDGENAIHPGATETCNGADDDCDGSIDPAASTGCTTYYLDADGDGAGLAGSAACLCAPSAPYSATSAGDCNDGTSAVRPGATEACNGVDDDCDGSIDPAGASGCTTYYVDADGDTYGRSDMSACLCAPSGTSTATRAGDCNDASASVSPGATERCCSGRGCTLPLIDENCNGAIDEDGAMGCMAYYLDSDGDGYGRGTSRCLCPSPVADRGDWDATVAGDCCDTDVRAYPGEATFYTSANACGSFDYDCNSTSEQQFTAYGICRYGVLACTPVTGWETAIPACGAVGRWVAGCGAHPLCSNTVTPRPQPCR